MLEQYYADMDKWAMPFQEMILDVMQEMISKLDHNKLVIMERSPATSTLIFGGEFHKILSMKTCTLTGDAVHQETITSYN